MEKSVLRTWKVPRDGTRRYFYDVWQPLAILVVTASFAGAFYATYNPNALRDPDDLFFCNADGNVELANSRYSPLWDPRLFFTINLAFGQFAFSTAKIIDAGWDTIVGRGGQMVMAVIAYRTIRRSLTLTMETCTVSIPTVAALCCQQVQLIPVGRLIHDVFGHLGSVYTPGRQPVHAGRTRLCMQIVACTYVLSFATMVSVMTGYSAQLTGYYGYDTEEASQLQPVGALSRAGMILKDRDRTRIGVSHLPIYASQKTIFPDIDTALGSRYAIAILLAKSRDVEEPYGTLIDYYYTCLGLLEWAENAPLESLPASYDLRCSWHECSCSVSGGTVQSGRTAGRYADNTIFANMQSNITLDGKRWNLDGPPLDIGLGGLYENLAAADIDSDSNFTNANALWSGKQGYFSMSMANAFTFTNGTTASTKSYIIDSNGTEIETDTISRTGRCVAQDAYSWGFSSLLLLTFCSYTILFALTLILLQTDVYWNSRFDRFHQHHAIYTDVLYLAEELKNALGHDVEAHIQSPRDFGKRVERRKQGLRLDVDELPLSRWQEWRLLWSLAAATTPEHHADETAYELRALKLKAHDRALAAPAAPAAEYRDLAAGAGDGSGSEVGKDSRRNSAAED